jgi:hypothetical protein
VLKAPLIHSRNRAKKSKSPDDAFDEPLDENSGKLPEPDPPEPEIVVIGA